MQRLTDKIVERDPTFLEREAHQRAREREAAVARHTAAAIHAWTNETQKTIETRQEDCDELETSVADLKHEKSQAMVLLKQRIDMKVRSSLFEIVWKAQQARLNKEYESNSEANDTFKKSELEVHSDYSPVEEHINEFLKIKQLEDDMYERDPDFFIREAQNSAHQREKAIEKTVQLNVREWRRGQ